MAPINQEGIMCISNVEVAFNYLFRLNLPCVHVVSGWTKGLRDQQFDKTF
jgi:hypothetical protein